MTNLVEEAKPVQHDVVETVKVDKNYFAELAALNMGGLIEKKQQFSYLSWAHAVDQLKRKYPDSKIITKRFPEGPHGVMVPYLKTETGYFVEVEVIVEGVSVSEPFPVLDNRNKPIAKPSSFDINNSIQRAKVKAIAHHGLGLYVYAGEDVPMNDAADQQTQQQTSTPPPPPAKMNTTQATNIKSLASQIAVLTSPPNSPSDLLNSKFKEVYQTFRITADLTPADADEVIMQMQNAIRNIDAQQMVSQPSPGDELFD